MSGVTRQWKINKVITHFTRLDEYSFHSAVAMPDEIDQGINIILTSAEINYTTYFDYDYFDNTEYTKIIELISTELQQHLTSGYDYYDDDK